PDAVEFALECSKGTYVRVLAADIGEALGTAAHLETLRRTRVGAFGVEQASPLDALVTAPPSAALPLVSVRTALAGYTSFTAPYDCARGAVPDPHRGCRPRSPCAVDSDR